MKDLKALKANNTLQIRRRIEPDNTPVVIFINLFEAKPPSTPPDCTDADRRIKGRNYVITTVQSRQTDWIFAILRVDSNPVQS
jgi:hypothetical protein